MQIRELILQIFLHVPYLLNLVMSLLYTNKDAASVYSYSGTLDHNLTFNNMYAESYFPSATRYLSMYM